jgi:hypothetical protein
MMTSSRAAPKTISISGAMIPDSKLAREATELVRDTEPNLLFNHSTRVYYFASHPRIAVEGLEIFQGALC